MRQNATENIFSMVWVGKDKDKLIILSAGNSNKISIFRSGGRAEAASACHCQLKLTVKQTTQQGHLSSDNFQKKKCRFSACFSLLVGVADSVQSPSELINHLLCVSFIFTMPQTPKPEFGGRKSFSKDMILFATSRCSFLYPEHTFR